MEKSKTKVSKYTRYNDLNYFELYKINILFFITLPVYTYMQITLYSKEIIFKIYCTQPLSIFCIFDFI